MKKKLTVFITVVVMACLGGGVIFAEDKIKMDNIRTKLRATDSSGDAWFSIQVTVRNLGDSDEKVFVTLQAVDSEGFELKSVLLIGLIRAHTSRVLTVKDCMPIKEYRVIDKWQVK